MRLTALTLTSYGNFRSEHITFDPRPGAINLLVAPNGGGKSVLRMAFCDLLFGIGGQSPMGFRYPYSAMRITADAVGPDNERFVFGRRKGQGNTLIGANGGALDPATIVRFLGRIDRTRLERLFALDTAHLREGEANLLASDGELGAALVSGAGGTQDLRALRKTLEQARDFLAPIRRSSQRPFYLALDKFVDARKREQTSLLRPDQWQKLEQALDAAEQRRVEQNFIADTESAAIARWERVRRVIPWLAAHDVSAAWLDAHPDAPVLDPGLALRLAEARAAIVITEEREGRERLTAGNLAEQLGKIVVDDRLLGEAAEIGRLVEATGAARKASSDLPTVLSRLDPLTVVVASRLRELGSSFPVERASDAIPPRASVNRARRLIQAYIARQDAAQAAPTRIAELERELATVLAEQTALVATGDVSVLEALVKEIRVDGDPNRSQRDAEMRRAEAAESLVAMLARVPGWTLGDTALVALAPLSPETYERHAADVGAMRSNTERQRDMMNSSRQARDEARDRLDAATKSSSLPDDNALTRARSQRDDGWQLIYRRAFTADPPTHQEERTFAGALPLPLAYERAVTAADGIADRRVQEAAAIERAQTAYAALQKAEASFDAAETQHRLAAEATAATERAWSQICAILPLGPSPTIREVQAFLTAREKVIDARQTLVAANATATVLEACHAGWAERLAAALTTQAETSLFVLLAAADKRLVQAQQAGRTRAALDATREATEKALSEAQARQHQAIAGLAEWRAEWNRAMAELNRPTDEDPSVTEDVLQVYADLDVAQKELVSLGERVSGMQRDNARFTEEAAALASRMAKDLDGTDPFLLVSTLRQRLQQAQELATQRDLLREQSLDAAKSAALAERQLLDRRAALQAILALVGASTVEAAEHRLGLAAERARHAASLAEAEAKLREAGDLRPLPELREEVAAVSSDEIPGRIDRAAQHRKEAQAAAQEAAATASALHQQMKQKAEDTGATDAAADQQSAIATIGRVIEEALVSHVAAEMLDRALAAVERDGEPELLRRIGELFKTLTGGTYSRVLTEIGDDNVTRLTLMQRDFPDERQSIAELSEGTRDQLYLALRLAAIEAHADSAPPLPFIGDDILQTFDDDRALAAMRVLGEISQKVQVILLTHHRHVLDLAAQLPAGSVHICRIGAAAVEAL